MGQVRRPPLFLQSPRSVTSLRRNRILEMKAKSAALLAAAGMLLTSVSVYSITPSASRSGDATPEVTAPNESTSASTLASIGAATQTDPAHFVAGSTLMVEGRIGRRKVLRSGSDQFILLEVTGAGSSN